MRQSTRYAIGSSQHRAHSRPHGFASDGGVQSESRPDQCAGGSHSRLCLAAAVRFWQRNGYRLFRRSVRIGALSENLTERRLLRNFLHPLNREEPTLVTAIRSDSGNATDIVYSEDPFELGL